MLPRKEGVPMTLDTRQRAALALTIPTAPIWRLSLVQYHDMVRTGILTDDDPVEFLEGLLVTKMPKNPPHSLATHLTRDSLLRIVPSGWYVDTQEPLTTDDSEPEPDVVVIRGTRRHYHDRHPGPQDVSLVIEVSDTTLQRDRTLKQRLYARAGIPIYWIINLNERIVECYTEPTGPSEQPIYAQRQDFSTNDILTVILDEQEIAQINVTELLP